MVIVWKIGTFTSIFARGGSAHTDVYLALLASETFRTLAYKVVDLVDALSPVLAGMTLAQVQFCLAHFTSETR